LKTKPGKAPADLLAHHHLRATQISGDVGVVTLKHDARPHGLSLTLGQILQQRKDLGVRPQLLYPLEIDIFKNLRLKTEPTTRAIFDLATPPDPSPTDETSPRTATPPRTPPPRDPPKPRDHASDASTTPQPAADTGGKPPQKPRYPQPRLR
jgi:hypothetical protein